MSSSQPASASVPELIKQINSLDPTVRASAEKALAALGMQAADPLIEVFSSGSFFDRKWEAKHIAAGLLTAMGEPRAAALIASYLAELAPTIGSSQDYLNKARSAAEMLTTLHWTPTTPQEAGIYWFLRDDPVKCAESGRAGIKPLLDILKNEQVGNAYNKLIRLQAAWALLLFDDASVVKQAVRTLVYYGITPEAISERLAALNASPEQIQRVSTGHASAVSYLGFAEIVLGLGAVLFGFGMFSTTQGGSQPITGMVIAVGGVFVILMGIMSIRGKRQLSKPAPSESA